MTYTVVTGPPCAGKSTWVREHARPDDIVIDYDTLAQALSMSNDEHDVPDAPRRVAMDARMTAITSAARQHDVDVWVIDSDPSPERHGVYRMARAIYHRIDPGIDVCLERAQQRPPETEHYIMRWYSRNPA